MTMVASAFPRPARSAGSACAARDAEAVLARGAHFRTAPKVMPRRRCFRSRIVKTKIGIEEQRRRRGDRRPVLAALADDEGDEGRHGLRLAGWDYYLEQSSGRFTWPGQVSYWVQVNATEAEFGGNLPKTGDGGDDANGAGIPGR